MTEPTTTPRTPEAVSDAVECAIGLNVDCGGTAGVHRVRDAVLAAIQPELDALAALRAVARGYCPTCGRGDAAPTVEDWEQQRQRAARAEAAIARVRNLVERLNDELASDADKNYARAILTALDQPAPAAAPQASGERCSARLAWTGSAKEALLKAEQQQWADAAGLSRADEDEAADVYEEMLRRIEASAPRTPATVPPVATEQQVTEALRAEISMLCDCCGNNHDRMNRIRKLVGLPAEDYGRGSDEEAQSDA